MRRRHETAAAAAIASAAAISSAAAASIVVLPCLGHLRRLGFVAERIFVARVVSAHLVACFVATTGALPTACWRLAIREHRHPRMHE